MSAFPLPRRITYALAFVSGLFYWLGFAGMDVWPCAFIAFVPLWIAVQGQTPKVALLAGLISGTTMNVFGFSWLLTMLKTFSGFPTVACMFFVLVVCTYQGGRLAFMGWLYARATQRGWPARLVFILAFAASEQVFPLLFPWYFGASLHDVPTMAQASDLGGPILLGVMMVVVNLAIAEPIVAHMSERKIDRRFMVAGAAVLALALVYGLVMTRIVLARAAASPEFTVGTVQANMGLFEKRSSFDEGLNRHLALTNKLKADGVDLVVWSETSVMRAERSTTYKTSVRDAVGRRLGVPSIIGSVLIEPVSGPRQYVLYNSALATNANGEVTSRYDKEYLLAFGEYLPFGDTFPILYEWSPNSGKFSSGTVMDPLLIEDSAGKTHKVTTLICYEDILPGFTNDAVRASNGEAELLVNMTNDAWFGDSAEPWEHLALAQLRAIEHRRYLVRSTNSGVSAIVDPVGRVMSHTKTFTQETLREKIHWMRASTVYEALGNAPWWLAAVGAGFMAFRRRRNGAGGDAVASRRGAGGEPAGTEKGDKRGISR